jgi:predicted acylesterase/phospholipase RssA/CRP-like cAMP-binding protein
MNHLKVEQQTLINWLTTSPVSDGLSPEEIARIAPRVEVKTFTDGELLGSIGEEVTEFWIIVEGVVEVFYEDLHGNQILLGTAASGDSIGEATLVEGKPRPVRLVAQTDGTLLSVPAAVFHELLQAYPVLMHNLYRKLTSRFKDAVGITRRKLSSPRVGIVAGSPRAHVLCGRLATRLLAAGERLAVRAEDPEALRSTSAWPAALPVAPIQAEEHAPAEPSVPGVDRQVAVFSLRHASRLDFRRVRHCDELLWLLEPEAASSTLDDLYDAVAADTAWLKKLRLVWLLDDHHQVVPCLRLPEFAKADIKVPVVSSGDSCTRLEVQGLDRLVRALRGYSLGIALAGGAAKGMAHLGVLRVLEEAGLSFDAMAGTSAGAMAGIFYASGMAPTVAAENFQRDLTPSRLFRMLPGWPNHYLLTQFRRGSWDGMLRNYLEHWRLEQLPIPFSAVTVDLIQGRQVVRRTGDAVHAILESINLPVLSKPIMRDGLALVDGGMLNNLPADVLAAAGCDFVIGVNVTSRMRPEFAGNRPEMSTEHMHDAGVLTTMFRIFETQAHHLNAGSNPAVNFWISPDTSDFAHADFYRTLEIVAKGEECARERLPELQGRLAALEQRLFDGAATAKIEQSTREPALPI